MAERICPACGCTIADSGYESGGVVYCCEPCSHGGPCEWCGRRAPEEEPEEKK